MERLLDIVFSCLALVALSPLLIPIGILLKLTGEGEVFFYSKTSRGERGKL
jgi:lipopolysaccharide/colanic/teichoic acid biosynthesis glycosyltransferase